jgi:hypothetical protein
MQLSKQQLVQCIVALSEPFQDEQVKQNLKNYLNGLSVAELEAKRDVLIMEPVEAALAAKESARIEHEKLRIVRHSGMPNTPENDAALDRVFGSAVSLELLRNYVDNNPDAALKNFTWHGLPFGETKKAEQGRTNESAQARVMFGEFCKTLALSGLADVRDSDANFSVVMFNITPPFTPEKLSSAIRTTPGLYPNFPEQIREWKADGQVKERHDLCMFLAQAKFGKKKTDERKPEVIQYNIDVEYQRLMTSRYVQIETLREQVTAMKEARRLSKLSPEELRAEARRVQPQPVQAIPVLPPAFTAQRIKQSSPEQIRLLKARFGSAVDDRLAGRS